MQKLLIWLDKTEYFITIYRISFYVGPNTKGEVT